MRRFAHGTLLWLTVQLVVIVSWDATHPVVAAEAALWKSNSASCCCAQSRFLSQTQNLATIAPQGKGKGSFWTDHFGFVPARSGDILCTKYKHDRWMPTCGSSTTFPTRRRRRITASRQEEEEEAEEEETSRHWNFLLVVAARIQKGYQQRVAADAQFGSKSMMEIILAASTQFAAEWNRRGLSRAMGPEVDFVFAGVLTAIVGKYYSMWRVAPTTCRSSSSSRTLPSEESETKEYKATVESSLSSSSSWWETVPTNAFQPKLLDGTTTPTLSQRFAALLVPMPPLFRAGMLASSIGYGFTALLIAIRSICLPSFQPVTRNVNVVHASLYTGTFMAVVSNLRYQVLQGMIEPHLQTFWFPHMPAIVTSLVSFAVRWANGVLGSVLAITGMRFCGLQQLRQDA